MKNKSHEERVAIYKEIARTYGKTDTAKSLATRFQLTPRDIGFLVTRLRKAGVYIPYMRGGGSAFKQAVKELKEEGLAKRAQGRPAFPRA